MSLTSLSDIRTGEWSREIAKKAEIPFSLLPTPYDPCDIVGGVTGGGCPHHRIKSRYTGVCRLSGQ